MTNLVCFSIIISALVSLLLAQYQNGHNPSWNYSNRQNFMAPMHVYAGIPLAQTNHPTAMPIDTLVPINDDNRNRNGLVTTRTTYFSYPLTTTTIRTYKRYHTRHRNRTRVVSTTTTTSDSLPQHFGIVVKIYEPTDSTTTTSITTSTKDPWWELTSTSKVPFFYERFARFSTIDQTTTTTTTTITITTTTIISTTTQRPWWESTSTSRTSSFYELFPKFSLIDEVYTDSTKTTTTSTIGRRRWLEFTSASRTPSFHERFPRLSTLDKKPPPPTVPKSFTAFSRYPYPFKINTPIPTTTTTTTTTTMTTSQPSIKSSTSTLSAPLIPSQASWLFNVPSFSQVIDQYPTYPTIVRWFKELSNHPNISRFFAYEIIGHTHENRSLIVGKIGLIPFRKKRRSVWIDGGIHAREWISTATVIHIIARLLNGTLARDADVRKLIDAYDFYFMPVVNPDGYAYTHDGVQNVLGTNEQQDQQRMWRKNRRPHNECPGVDLNRNFPFAWDNRGASKFPCEETYRGPYPESEPEVHAMTSFILRRRRYFHTFITLHAFGNLWMLPFSFSTFIRPHDYHRTERLLLEINRLSMNTFKIGQSSTVLYPATGTSEDWAKAVAQIPHTFSVELPPSADAFEMRQDDLNGFTFYSNKDIGTVAESTYRLVCLYLKSIANIRNPSRITI